MNKIKLPEQRWRRGHIEGHKEKLKTGGAKQRCPEADLWNSASRLSENEGSLAAP